MFGAVLTLPGIAGVILTIGMGVDSNVLVFERIREELRNGKSSAAAVDAGFDKAFLTIIDTHVTTVVSAFFLFIFGTGPIKGFAITLTIGLIANVFTAIYLSKAIFHYHLGKMDRQAELSI
jgi:preprotein translocase subunit SecD